MLIVLPLKTSKRYDISRPLTLWIQNFHPYLEPYMIRDDLIRLASIRNCLTDALGTPYHGHEAALSDRAMPDLQEYHACLLACEARNFPKSEEDANKTGATNVNLQLSWKSAFTHVDEELDPIIRANLTYERCCVLWNIAALESYCAAVHDDWKTKEGRASALKRYGVAAAILKHIRIDLIEDANIDDDVSSADLTPQCLHMCERLMLAQGQMACYEAAKVRCLTANPPMHQLLAKLAVGAADFYNQVLKASQDNEMLGHLPNTSRSYGAHAKVMSMLFQARSQYLESLSDRSKRSFGREIVRLGQVDTMCTEGHDFVCGFKADITTEGNLGNIKQTFELLRRTALERKSIVEKDNYTIFHDDVAKIKELPIIQGQDMMWKPVSLPNTLKPESLKRPFFANLPPSL